MPEKSTSLYVINAITALTLLSTLSFIILSCYSASVSMPWLALGSGAASLVLGIVRYLRL